MRTTRDVALQRVEGDQWVVISREAGVVGEMLTLDRDNSGGAVSVKVRVTESRPVIVAGALRHLMRLESV